MRIGKVLIVLMVALALMNSICVAEMTAMGLRERLRQSDLVIVGEILKSYDTRVIKRLGVENWVAECRIKQTIKGRSMTDSNIKILFTNIPSQAPSHVKLLQAKEYLLFLRESKDGANAGAYEMITPYHGAFEAGENYFVHDEQSPEFPMAVMMSFDAIVSRLTNDLLLTIKSDKGIYEEAEEIRLTLEFKNVGRKNIWLLKPMAPGADLQLRSFRLEGGNKQDVSFPVKIDVLRQILLERDFTELLAQETFLKEMSLGDFSENAVLAKGRYEVLLELNLDPAIFIHLLIETEPRQSKIIPWIGRLVSNAITIEIRDKRNTVLPSVKQVLYETNRIMSAQAGEMAGDPAEIIAFNAIYHSNQAAEIFKEVYKKSRSAGKFYCLIGLYLLQDKAFEDLKADFLKNEQEKVYCQYGCKVSENNDVKQVLDTWLEGIPKELWYTKIVKE